MLSPDRLARIAIDSLSPWERLAANLCIESPTEPQRIEERLRQWRNAACEGDEALFLERLARDGLEVTSVRRVLGSIKVPSHFKLPQWCDVLSRVLAATPGLRDVALAPDVAKNFLYLNARGPLPFEGLFLPFVEVALRLLAESGAGKLSDDVLNAFARELLQKLTEIAARVLAVEFRAFLALRQFADDSDAGIEPGLSSYARYQCFIAKSYGDGWGPLFEEYCVMARLLAVAVVQWVDSVDEFEKRLFNDLPEIEITFNRRKPSGSIIAIDAALSDPHDGGRSVIAIEFSSGLKLIYKPRSLGIERAYFEFAAWINRFDELLPFRVLQVLDRGEYGWVEYVEHRSCGSDEELQRYYRRAGNLLCLVYALNGSDFHYQNLIADGEYPVPIDLETIYHHRTKLSGDDSDDTDEMAARLRVSVLSTDLLPDPVKLDHQYFDISGLARSEEEEGEAEAIVWSHVNTDGMDYSYQRQRPQPAGNLPKLNDKVAILNDYTKFILSGFEEAYRFLQQKVDLLVEANGPLRAMFAHDARFIYRSTALYNLILRRALHPPNLRDGVDFGLQFEILAQKLLKLQGKPVIWPLMQVEMASLWKLDVPRFTLRGDGNALRLSSGNSIAGCFIESAWNFAHAKISGLSEADLRWQLSLVAGSFDVRSANLWTDQSIADDSQEYRVIDPFGRDELLKVAIELGKEIESNAFRQGNGDLGWMVLNYSPAAERYTLQPMENDLYNGRAGVGLFFAALERIMPGSSYRALARASLAPIQRWIKLANDEELTEFGFGGYAGLSSIAYALTRAGEFLNEGELIADATVAALRIRPHQIGKDESLDAMNGSAGAILCLLACYTTTGERTILDSAIACGRDLLQRREPDKFGCKTWPTLDKRHLTGFSHGAAGIAYALLQLYKVTADVKFYDAAVEGIDFEGRAFIPEYNNWPDLRRATAKFSRPTFSMAWCHGAPGIGLGRIAALDIMDTLEVRRDIQAALASTGAVNLLPRDHLCCGNAGLMDTLCTAGERLAQGEWSRKALQLAARSVARGNERGGFSIAFDNGFFNPSLFQGAAGIGYQMLRLSDPVKIPSVLLLN
ncbi:MAG TPA: type 2 lanthipeptide synthetase LanM family protein [Xanthobacteraceae bacterium]|nr:type 2 lanthipeptide synthetase LanM family protein [Xanthobacteraceae bacterium]